MPIKRTEEPHFQKICMVPGVHCMKRFAYLFSAILLAVGFPMMGQAAVTAMPQARILGPVQEEDRVSLVGNLNPVVHRATASEAVAADTEMEDLVLVLGSGSDQRNALQSLLAEQKRIGSAHYNRFLKPAEFEAQFGVAVEDRNAIKSWLKSYGMRVKSAPAGGRLIVFSATAAAIEAAFHCELRSFQIDGVKHLANAAEPTIPRAFAAVIQGIVGLQDFEKKPQYILGKAASKAMTVMPEFAPSGLRWLVPGDFTAIYDTNPLISTGIDGTGETIAVIARSDIYLSDVQSFRNGFGLKANDPVFVVTNSDPGQVNGDNLETTLDTEWAGAVAPGATVEVLISSSGQGHDGVDLSSMYAVTNNVAPIITVSYGACEAAMGSSGAAFYNTLWQQAAAQGQTVLVASGDSGAAGCDGSGSAKASHGKGVNGLCSSPYSTCVGGTQFVEGSNPAQYWYPASLGSGSGSAMGYIPEAAWNESGASAAGASLASGGGGASLYYSKPSWQNGTGVPADKMRDVPDLSLTAALHDGYTIVQGGMIGYLFPVSGTSASTPAFAGIMALVDAYNKSAQGNINPVLYSLANQQKALGSKIYHDVTTGNNSVPGQTGFTAGTGYDLATGLGSVDANLLATLWSAGTSSPAALTVTVGATSVNVGQSGKATVVTIANGLNAAVTLSVGTLPTGLTASLSSSSIAAPGSGSATLTLMASSSLATGIYPVTVTASSGQQTVTTVFDVAVTMPTFILQYSGGMYPQVFFGPTTPYSPQTISLQTQPANGFNQQISFSASGLPTGMAVSFQPAKVSGSAVANVVATVTAANTVKGGNYNFTIQAAGGGVTQTVAYTANVFVQPSCSLKPDQYSGAFQAGSGMKFTLSCTASKANTNQVNLAVTGAPGGLTAQLSSATVSPTGKVTLTLTSTSDTNPGTYPLTITGTEANGAIQQVQVFVAISTPVFALSLNPSTITAYTGMANQFTAVITPDAGFSSPVNVWVGGVPNGVARSIGSNSVANPSTAVTLTVDKSTVKGSYSFTVGAGTVTGFSRQVTTTLVIAAPPICSLATTPGSWSVVAGKTATATLSCTVTSGSFPSGLNLAINGLPQGVTATLNTQVLTPGKTATVTLAAASTTTLGSSSVTVTAANSVYSQTITVPLKVTAK